VRRGLLIVVAVGLLVAPTSAGARKVHFTGQSTRDPMVAFSFDAVGRKEIGRHGMVVVPAKVRNFSVTNVNYECGGFGIPTVGTRRSDLPFGSIGPLKVNKRGSFNGTFIPPSPPNIPNGRFSVTGSFRKGKASGSFLGSEGPSATGLSCSTGGHRWVASPAG
jgi:hypothetical protein